MTRLWGDGFEGYSAGTDLALRYNTYVSAALGAEAETAFTSGQCAHTIDVTKVFEDATNEATIFFSIRLKFDSPVQIARTFVLEFLDGGTAQCAVKWNAANNSIVVYSGSALSGTPIATWTSAFSLNVWDSWQGKVIINSSTGEVTLRKNGSTSTYVTGTAMSTTITSANTRGGTGNNYANEVRMDGDVSWLVDDLWLNDNDGTDPTDWPPDVRGIALLPNGAGTDTDLTPDQATRDYGATGDSTTSTFDMNKIYGVRFQTAVGGTIDDIFVNFVGAQSGHAIAAIYDGEDAPSGTLGSPGSLLRETGITTDPAGGLETMALTSSLTLERDHYYWIFLLGDFDMDLVAGIAGPTMVVTAHTYSSGFDGVVNYGHGGGPVPPLMYTTLTPFNWSLVADPVQDADTTYVYSANIGDKDFYTVAQMGVTPTSILGVEPIVYWRKQNSGYRQAALIFKANGSASVDEVTTDLSVGYTAASKFLPQDPTAVDWTQSTVEGAQLGTKVTG